MNLVGVDVGGTKTAICVGNERGEVRVSRRFPSAAEPTQDGYFRRLQETYAATLKEAGLLPGQVDAVGISAPGPLDVNRGVLIAPPNNPGWLEVPMVERVRQIAGCSVHMNHDGKACALAEWLFGECRGARNLVYLTFSTGMGGGIILNGELVQGATDSAGEVGHQILDPKGPLCGCGMRGCWEAYVGGRSLAERVRERIVREGVRTSIVDKAGGQLAKVTAKEVEDAAREGDPFAVAVWDEFLERVAQGVGNLIMLLNPEVVVLGTIAIRAGDFVMVPLREKLKKYVWEWPLQVCRVVPSSLGERIADLSALAVAVVGLRRDADAQKAR